MRQEGLDALVGPLQGPAVLVDAVVVEVERVHGVDDVVGEGQDEGVDLDPVVDLVVLLLVEPAQLLAREVLELLVALAVRLEGPAVDARQQLVLDVARAVAVDGGIDYVLEAILALRAKVARLEIVPSSVMAVERFSRPPVLGHEVAAMSRHGSFGSRW